MIFGNTVCVSRSGTMAQFSSWACVVFSHPFWDLVTLFRQRTVWDCYPSRRLVLEFPLSSWLPLISVLAFSYSTMGVLWTTPTTLSIWVLEWHKKSILAPGTGDKGSEEEGKNLSRIALRKYSDFGENCFVLILDLPSSKNPNSYWPLPSQFWGMVGPFSARLWIY